MAQKKRDWKVLHLIVDYAEEEAVVDIAFFVRFMLALIACAQFFGMVALRERRQLALPGPPKLPEVIAA